MFPAEYFAPRFFNARFYAKIGQSSVLSPTGEAVPYFSPRTALSFLDLDPIRDNAIVPNPSLEPVTTGRTLSALQPTTENPIGEPVTMVLSERTWS